MKNKTMKLIESIQTNLDGISNKGEYNKNILKEDSNNLYSTFEEFENEVKQQGGLYGFIGEKYYSMDIELLKEIALNAVYELNDDSKVLADIKERVFDNLEGEE